MTKEPLLQLPDHVRRLREGERFTFACHPNVPCFTECCRQLDLALSPYDVLRLCRKLGLTGKQFIDRYAVIEQEEGDIFPQVYLGMTDDGRASCPFVAKEGCKVYQGRPAACRTYPLGRGAWLDNQGNSHAFFVLLREPHCKGFAEPEEISLDLWIADQGLNDYYTANDLLVPLLQHEKIRKGFRPGENQCRLYLSTLYELDRSSEKTGGDTSPREDFELLQAAITRLISQLFG